MIDRFLFETMAAAEIERANREPETPGNGKRPSGIDANSNYELFDNDPPQATCKVNPEVKS